MTASVADWHAEKACLAYAKAQFHARKEQWAKYEAALAVFSRHIRIADLLRVQ